MRIIKRPLRPLLENNAPIALEKLRLNAVMRSAGVNRVSIYPL